jgi:hypothetical protein
LHDKQQRAGLAPGEQTQEAALRKLYRETLLVRAQAVALLQQLIGPLLKIDHIVPQSKRAAGAGR